MLGLCISAQNLPWRITFLSCAFCGNMLLMELAMEAMTRKVSALDGPSVGLAITLAQFGGCFFVGWFSGGRLTTDRKGVAMFEWKAFLPYVGLSFLIFCATGLANLALAYVQYPVKVVFKSSKLVPVMIVSVIMRNSKAYSWKEYSGAVLICMGTAIFAWKPAREHQTAEMAHLGILLLSVAAIGDALSSNLQQRMMQREDVSPMTLMARLNFVGLMGVTIVQIFSGSAYQLYVAAGVDHMMFLYMAGIGITIGFGVWANTNLINEAGSVFAMTVATLRKVVTMLLSYMVFPKPFTIIQIGAAATVFMGIILSDFFKTKTKTKIKEVADTEANKGDVVEMMVGMNEEMSKRQTA